MILLILLPIIYITISLYLSLTFLGTNLLSWCIGLIGGSIIYSLTIKTNYKLFWNDLQLTILNISNLVAFIPIVIFLASWAMVVSPLVLTKHQNNFEHIQLTGVGDYYKHTFVVTSLSQDGIPPKNPYFPSTNLSYYYGFYLISAALTKVFSIPPNWSFYIFSLFAYTIGLSCVFKIYVTFIKKTWVKILASLLLVTAVGIDVFPQIIEESTLLSFINPSILTSGNIFALINNYKSFIYVPQHFFSAIICVLLIYFLIKERYFNELNLSQRILITVSMLAFVFLSSTFVAMTMSFWLVLIFLFLPKTRKLLFISGVFTIIVLIPYLLFLSNRSNLFYYYNFTPYQVISLENTTLTYVTNILLTLIVKYGLIIIILPALFFLRGLKFAGRNIIFLVAVTVPLFITFFIRSPIYNDFSMRTSIPIQIILPLFIGVLLEKTKSNIFKIIITLSLMITIALGVFGWYLEYSRHWKNRLILHPNVSEYLLKVRELPMSEKLISVDRDRWVELTPPLGYRKITNPFLYDSYVYFANDQDGKHAKFETGALQYFINEDTDKSIEDLVNSKNQQYENLHNYFNMFSADTLVLNNQLWVKEDINPWLQFFTEIKTETSPLTSHFTLIDFPNLISKLANNYLQIDTTKPSTVEIIDKTFPLQKGFWYIASCSDSSMEQKLELEDYYLLFNKQTDGDRTKCVGRIFYLQNDENVKVMDSTTVKQLIIYPIKIKTNNL